MASPTPDLFRLDRARAAADLRGSEDVLWPVNAYSDADELNLLLEAAQNAAVLTPEPLGARVYIYPLSISEPEPLLAVSPGAGPTLLGHELKLCERDGEDPVEFTLRLLEEIVAEANALCARRNYTMNESHRLPGNNPSSSSSTVSPPSPPLVIVAAVGDPGGSRAVAAALTCAGIGGAQAPLFIELAGAVPRPTLVASVQARALEERLVMVVPGIAAAARGGFCQVALRADAEGFAAAAAAVDAAGGAPIVVHVPGARLSALLDDALASRASAALVRSETEVDRALAAPVALELLSRGFTVALLERRLGWVTERRALFGALRGSDLHELPRALIQWLASYALGVPSAPSESAAVGGLPL